MLQNKKRLNSELNQDKQSDDNFPFYMFISNFKNPGGGGYLAGPAAYAEALFSSYQSVGNIIANSGGFVTASLNVPEDMHGRHMAYLGLSSNLVVEIHFSDTGFEQVSNISLLQEKAVRPGWQGGVISLSYVDGFLFAGMGDRQIVTANKFQWKEFYQSLWAMSPSFDWKHKEDHIGGAVKIYNFSRKQWQAGIDDSGDKAAVTAMRSFKVDGQPIVLSFASEGGLPQTVSKGFSITTEVVGDAPLAYAYPTASKVVVSRLQYLADGLQLAVYNETFNFWSYKNLFPNFWESLPSQVIVGESSQHILYAAFQSGHIRALNLNAIGGDTQGWVHITTYSKGAISSIMLNPYADSATLIVAKSDQSIETFGVQSNLISQLAAFDANTKYMGITSAGSDHYIVYVTDENSIYMQKNQEEAVCLQDKMSEFDSITQNSKTQKIDSVALSNLIVGDDGFIYFYVGYCTADIWQCKVDIDNLDNHQCQFIRSYANEIGDGLPFVARASPSYIATQKYGTYSFYVPLGTNQTIAAYPAEIIAKLNDGQMELLVQSAKVKYKRYYGDNAETSGYGSYTARFDPNQNADELKRDVSWSTFASNIYYG
jgi:hypothetical protein